MSSRTHSLLVAFAAAGLLAPRAGSTQPELPLATTDAQIALVDQIAVLRAEGGPTPADSIDPLHALALLYQEDGNDALAIGVFEEARHVTRVHQGLSSADEAVLLRQQIRSEKALGLDQRVWDLEQDMVTIARRNLDDVRMAPIFRELAEDRSEALAEYRAGYLPPEVDIGCYHAAPLPRYDDPRGRRRPPVGADGGCRTGQSHTVVNTLRSEILLYYADAIETLVKSGDYASQELRDLEKQALRVSPKALTVVSATATALPEERAPFDAARSCRRQTFEELFALEILGSCLEPVRHRNGFVVSNVGGWVGHVRLIAYEMRSAAPAADRANAMAELADWLLLTTPAERRRFENGDLALAIYERAHRELRTAAPAQTSIGSIFSPALPVTIPEYEPNPLDTSAASQSPRHIDVAFVVTKHGRGERIETLDTSRNATRGEERDLVRLIESATFRPRIVDGELAAAAPVTLRYHLGYSITR